MFTISVGSLLILIAICCDPLMCPVILRSTIVIVIVIVTPPPHASYREKNDKKAPTWRKIPPMRRKCSKNAPTRSREVEKKSPK